MKVEIVSIGGGRNKLIETAAYAALEEMDLQVEVVKVRHIEEAKQKGVTSLPALIINGQVMVQGRLPTVDEVKELLAQAQGKIVDYSVA